MIPRKYNGVADLLSRWGSKDCFATSRRAKNCEGYKKEIRDQNGVMQDLIKDEVWRMIHDRHVGMCTMRHRGQVWRIRAKKAMLRES